MLNMNKLKIKYRKVNSIPVWVLSEERHLAATTIIHGFYHSLESAMNVAYRKGIQ